MYLCVRGINVPRQESERSCICVLGVSIFPLPMIFNWILELFRQCGIFCFRFMIEWR